MHETIKAICDNPRSGFVAIAVEPKPIVPGSIIRNGFDLYEVICVKGKGDRSVAIVMEA